jgi:hypothetical protein
MAMGIERLLKITSERATMQELRDFGLCSGSLATNPSECYATTNFLERGFLGVCWWEGDFQ